VKKTLVTGGTGFLGSHLVSGLARTSRGAAGDLRVMVQSTPPAWLRDLGVELCTGSVTRPEDVARALDGVDRVYHLAGMVSHKPSDGHRMYAVHVDGTRILCEAAVRAGVMRIVMSSNSGTIAYL
jgi:dihydroflavonol-4-reductase